MILDLMSMPVTVKEDAYVTHVRQIMREGHRSLPVVDAQNRIKGMVTLTDILKVTSTKSDVTVSGFIQQTGIVSPDADIMDAARIFGSTGFDIPVARSHEDSTIIGVIDSEKLFNKLFNNLNFKMEKAIVGDIMTRTVRTCNADDPVSKVWLNMTQYGLSGYPIMKRKRLVGIITLKDLLSAGYVRLEREDERGGRDIYPPNVEKVMKTPVMTVVSDSTIWEAANLMRQYGIGRLPVVEDRKLIGIVDRQDLVKVII